MKSLIQTIKTSKAPQLMSSRIIAIDGYGGAGKSTLASYLVRCLQAPVIHTDDFANWDNPLEWWPRLIEEVLEPLSKNQISRYQRYDWDTRKLAEWQTIAPADYIILEGVSSTRQAFRPYLAFSIWVETARQECLRRGLERDGSRALENWIKWMENEDNYVAEELPQQFADIIVSGERPPS